MAQPQASAGLPDRAEVVVVGGGAIGTSVAFHLAEAGVPDVLLLERSALGSGSTGAAAGGVRATFSDEVNVRIALRSLDALDAFGERPGGEIDLRRVGYLFLLDRPADVEAFERGAALQNRLGAPTLMLSPAEAARKSPLAGTGGVLAAAFDPLAGHATPDALVQGYAAGARRHGATLLTGCEVTAIEPGLRLTTTRGNVEAGTVVCAAGPWSAGLGAMAGVDLPVTPYRRQIAYTGPLPGLPGEIPMTIDFSSGLYFHREGPGLLFGMGLPDEPPGFGVQTDDVWLERAAEPMRRRAPVLADAPIAGGWAGLYEVTPDHNGLIGEAEGPGGARLLYATGFSGHGFLQAPAVGEIVRDLYLERPPPVDPSPLSAERFAGKGRPERNVV